MSKEPLDLRKSTSEADGVVFNYFLPGSRDSYRKLENFNRSASPELGARALKIANEVRQAAISYITADTKKETWSEEVRTVANRLQNVRFELAKPGDSVCKAQADTGIPAIGYDPATDSVGICPGQVKTTTQDIAAAIAHELGHVVSPCAIPKELQIYKGIRDCLEKRYASEYTKWSTQIENQKQSTSLICYRKLNEHFAESFGGFAYSKWIQSRDMTPAEFERGLHFLISIQCVENTTKSFSMSQDYPSTRDRIALFLKPQAVTSLLGCQLQPSQATNSICSLTEDSFTRAPSSSRNSEIKR